MKSAQILLTVYHHPSLSVIALDKAFWQSPNRTDQCKILNLFFIVLLKVLLVYDFFGRVTRAFTDIMKF